MILNYLRQFMFWRTYYHFTNGDVLRDGRPLPKTGEWLVHDGPIVICESGLHASLKLEDAFQYAPGFNLHLVKLSGLIKTCPKLKDKFVARKRQIVSSVDVKPILLRFLQKNMRKIASKIFPGEIAEHFSKELVYSTEIMNKLYNYEGESSSAALFLRDMLRGAGGGWDWWTPINYFCLLRDSFIILGKDSQRALDEFLLAIYEELQNDSKRPKNR